MHMHVIRSSPTCVRYGVIGVVTRVSLTHRQSIRNLLDGPYVRRTGRIGLRAKNRRKLTLSRFEAHCAISASSLAMDTPELLAENETQLLTAASKLSELSNGTLPDTIKLGETLGKGTFGEVYQGVDTITGEEFAIKIISKKRSGNDDASIRKVMQFVEHEVSMWCELHEYPGVVRLEKFYEDDDQIYLVEELCTGGSLQDLMAMRGYLSEAEAAHVMYDVLSLLVFCHERAICYCDIKPANFILARPSPTLDAFYDVRSSSNKEFVKVIDFGSCEHVTEKGLRGQKGTPLYTAPEVQHTRYGVECDIWSAGVLMYYLLSGEIPFIGKPNKNLSPSALNFYLAHAELKFEGPVWETVSQEAKDLITLMLERNVKKRLTAAQALEDSWIKKRAVLPMMTTAPPTSFSDICPLESPSRSLKEV